MWSRQSQRGFQRDFEGLQIAVVDPDDPAPAASAIPVRAVVHLDQRRHAVARRIRGNRESALRREWRRSADGVRAVRRGFQNVVFAEVKSLRSTGRPDRSGAQPQVLQAALKKCLVGQDRERRGAAALILLGQSARFEMPRSTPLLGDAFLISAMMAGEWLKRALAKIAPVGQSLFGLAVSSSSRRRRSGRTPGVCWRQFEPICPERCRSK